jgi:hypothetical protein
MMCRTQVPYQLPKAIKGYKQTSKRAAVFTVARYISMAAVIHTLITLCTCLCTGLQNLV